MAQRPVNGIPIVRIYENRAHDITGLCRSDAWFCSLASVVDEADLIMASGGDIMLTVMCMDAYVFILTPQKDARSMPLQSFFSGLVIILPSRIV